MSRRIPAEVFPPGEFIRDELEARGWTQADLADILGRPLKTISDVLLGKRAITPETAHGLGAAFGTDPQFWMNLESAYRLSLVEKRDEEVSKRAKLYEKAPIKDMVKRHWIKETETIRDLENELIRFFELASIDDEPSLLAMARKSTSYSETTAAQLAWLFRVKRLASSLDVAPFRPEMMGTLSAELRQLTTSEHEARRVPRILAQYGIRFVVVEHLPKTKIDGAALWIDPTSPVVAVSIRYDRVDCFWHTVGHELGHVVNGDGLKLDDDMVSDRSHAREEKPEAEKKADEFACNLLVPRLEIESFIARIRPLYSKKRIVQFANRIRVHPGIIIGQLQRRGEINYSQGREFLVKVRDEVTQSALTDGWGHYLPLG